MASTLIGETHGTLLRLIASSTGKHFEGLGQVSRSKHLTLTSKQRRWLLHLDITWNIVRHITEVRTAEIIKEISDALSTPQGDAAPINGTSHGNTAPLNGTFHGITAPHNGTSHGITAPPHGASHGNTAPQSGTSRGNTALHRGTSRGNTAPRIGTSQGSSAPHNGTALHRGTSHGNSAPRGGGTSHGTAPRGSVAFKFPPGSAKHDYAQKPTLCVPVTRRPSFHVIKKSKRAVYMRASMPYGDEQPERIDPIFPEPAPVSRDAPHISFGREIYNETIKKLRALREEIG